MDDMRFGFGAFTQDDRCVAFFLMEEDAEEFVTLHDPPTYPFHDETPVRRCYGRTGAAGAWYTPPEVVTEFDEWKRKAYERGAHAMRCAVVMWLHDIHLEPDENRSANLAKEASALPLPEPGDDL